MRAGGHWFRFLLLALAVAGIAYALTGNAQPRLSVSILPAGKGNAVLVRAPGGRAFLINGGSDASVLRALGASLPEWERALTAVVLTSPASGEAGGIPEVFDRYRVGEFIRPEAKGSKTTEEALAATVPATYAYRGDRFALGADAYLDVLWPPVTPAPMSAGDGALLVRLSYGRTSFIIDEGLSARAEMWVREAYAGAYAGAVVIGTSTPPRTYLSDGTDIAQK